MIDFVRVGPDGKPRRRYKVTTGPAAVIIAIVNGKLLIQWHYREIPNEPNTWIWELPAGRVDAGENFIQAGIRELKEETGFIPKAKEEVKLIFNPYSSPGFTDEVKGFVLVECGEQKEQELESGEFLQLHLKAPEELKQMLAKGEIVDLATLLGVYYYLYTYLPGLKGSG